MVLQFSTIHNIRGCIHASHYLDANLYRFFPPKEKRRAKEEQ